MLIQTWTDDRIEQLKKLLLDGLSCSRIAVELGGEITRNAVIGKIHRLGLAAAKITRSSDHYRPGPATYEEKSRREAARLTKRMLATAARQAAREARQKVRKITNYGSHMTESRVWSHVPIQEPEPAPDFLAITFGALQRESCRYPRGENADMRFCGQPKMKGFSYCQHCYAITHYIPNNTTPHPNHWAAYLARAA